MGWERREEKEKEGKSLYLIEVDQPAISNESDANAQLPFLSATQCVRFLVALLKQTDLTELSLQRRERESERAREKAASKRNEN